MNTKSLQEMVTELLESGMTQPQLADMVGTNQPQISRIKHGQNSEYDLGKRVEAVYIDRIINAAA